MDTETKVETLWISYKQGQQLSGLSRGTIWKIIGEGSVQAAKVGTRVLINRRSLESYLESQSYAEVVQQ